MKASIDTSETRYCAYSECRKLLFRRQNERREHFSARKYCSHSCSSKDFHYRKYDPVHAANEYLNIGNPLANTKCPVHKSILEQWYCRDLSSTNQIAARIGCTGKSVTNWLHKIGVPIRSLSANAHLSYKHSSARQANAKTIYKKSLERGTYRYPSNLKSSQKKASLAVAKKKLRRRTTRKCCLPGCMITISRCPSQMQKEYIYCCKSHCMIHRHQRKQFYKGITKVDTSTIKHILPTWLLETASSETLAQWEKEGMTFQRESAGGVGEDDPQRPDTPLHGGESGETVITRRGAGVNSCKTIRRG